MWLDSTVKVYPTKFTDGLGVGVGWERKDDSRDFGLSHGRMAALSPSMGKTVERAGSGVIKYTILDLFTMKPLSCSRRGAMGTVISSTPFSTVPE